MLYRALSHRPLFQASFTLLAALVVGCGGKVLVDGNGAGGAGGTGNTGTTGTSTITSNSTATGVTTGQGTGGISTGPDTTAVSVGSGPDTTASVGSGPDTTASVGSGPDTTSSSVTTGAGGSGPVAQVSCNNQQCNDGEICCFNLTMPTDHCGQAGNCGDGYIELACNGPEDCPNNQICCASIDQNQGMVPYTGIACQDTCQGMNTRIVCGSAGSAVCNPGDSCKNSQTLGSGYKVCRP